MSKNKRPESKMVNETGLTTDEVIEEAIDETEVEEIDEEIEVEEIDDETKNQAEPIKLKGLVVNCKKLNIRKKPSINSEPVCVVEENAELLIGQIGTEEWYPVTTKDGIKGFCMSKYVKIER